MKAERIGLTVEKLKELTGVAIDLQQMGLRSNASIELFGAGFSIYIDPSIALAIRLGECPMRTVANIPEIKELLDSALSYHPHQRRLLNRIVPSIASELMGLSKTKLDDLETLQDHESSKRHHNDSLKRLYLAKGGRPDFQGAYAWGLIDHNGTNFYFDHQTEEIRYLIRFATILPHVRYECIFKGDLRGSASISEQLVINPRVAFIPTGFSQWYKHLQPLQ